MRNAIFGAAATVMCAPNKLAAVCCVAATVSLRLTSIFVLIAGESSETAHRNSSVWRLASALIDVAASAESLISGGSM